jgi:Tfp pilus assembly protein PilP
LKKLLTILKKHSTTIWLVLLVVLTVFVTLPLISCGGEEVKEEDLSMKLIREKEEEIKARRAAAKETAATHSPDALVKVKLTNEGWRKLAPFFKQYIERGLKIRMSTDVFRPHAAEMLPRPKLRFPSDQVISDIGSRDSGKKTKTKQQNPLREFSLSELRVVLIMTNTARPKAVIVDPKGVSYTVTATPPTPIGNANGFVERIGQYVVLVRENDQIKRLNSLKPLYFDLRKGPVPKKDLKTSASDTARTAGVGTR